VVPYLDAFSRADRSSAVSVTIVTLGMMLIV